MDFGAKIDPKATSILQDLSDLGAGPKEPQPVEKLVIAARLLYRLRDLLPTAAPLVAELTDTVREDHPNEEHARMVEAVAAVVSAGIDLHEPIRSWVE